MKQHNTVLSKLCGYALSGGAILTLVGMSVSVIGVLPHETNYIWCVGLLMVLAGVLGKIYDVFYLQETTTKKTIRDI